MATTDTLAEIIELDSQFIKALNDSGLPDLVELYNDINTLREAHNVRVRRALYQVVMKGTSSMTANGTASRQRPARNADDPSINLRGAVRDEKETFAGKSFTTRQMYDHLLEKHGLVMNDKLSSLSATLANMSGTGGELHKEVGPQRKVKFSFA